MTSSDTGDLFHPDRPPREGLYDAQLRLPSEERPLIESIRKRDGREVTYDARKVAETIHRAAESIGAEDWHLAQDLAAAVTLYLSKMLRGEPPTVDHVHDAVERVLIAMDHPRTALAYVRYRDKRIRIRQLRNGDQADILDELNDARREREAAGGQRPGALFMHTGRDAVTDWDRGKIVDSLIRETGLDHAPAERIASEVDAQIRAAGLRITSGSLVRELVDAKLAEHGLEAYRQRYMRLGVPLYDAERIICSPYDGCAAGVHDPETTNSLLAERVKKEYALTQVFSESVSNAHLSGDFHLHYLGMIDRMVSLHLSPEYCKRFGMTGIEGRRISSPARQPETLVAQQAGLTGLLRRHFTGVISWDSINFALAPYLTGADESGAAELAKVLIHEFAYRRLTHGESGPEPELSVSWTLPEHLRDVEAIGPGGTGTGRTYNDYVHRAQRLAWALLDAYQDAAGSGHAIPAPRPILTLNGDFFHAQGHERFLRHSAAVTAAWGRVRFRFDRDAPLLPHTVDLNQPRELVAHCVTLNLPRLAYRTGSEQLMAREVDSLMDLAGLAHLEKRAFILRLLEQGSTGPLGLLAADRANNPFCDLDRALFVVGLTGLNECVQHLHGRELYHSDTALRVGEDIIRLVHERCAQWSEDGLPMVLAPMMESGVSRRFAELDLEQYGAPARRVVKCGNAPHDVHYTPGVQLGGPEDLTPLERLRGESRFHPYFGWDAATHLPAPNPDTSPESVATFLTKAYRQTSCREIVYQR